jgi:cytochrome d ubiquinol oxidase subunit II
MAVLLNVGLNGSSFYPSVHDLQSSLTIENASGSHYTLSAMGYASLMVPFVLGYIFVVWRAMDRVKITEEEMHAPDEHHY